MGEIYKCQITTEEEALLEVMRSRIGRDLGVTLNGNRLTLRWYQEGKLVDVHAVILRVGKDGDDGGCGI